MEDFSKQLNELKANVIAETAKLVAEMVEKQDNCRVAFVNPVMCYFTNNDACYLVANDIRYNNEDGSMYLYGNWPNGDAADAISIKLVSAESCVEILDHLRDKNRYLKVAELRDLISKAGGRIKFDNYKEFLFCNNPQPQSYETTEVESHFLYSVNLLSNDIEFITSYLETDDCGSECTDFYIEQIPNDTLDKIIAYIKEQTEKIDILLTDEQLKVMDEFYNAVKKMQEADIMVIRNTNIDGGFYFINGKGLEFEPGFDADTDGYTDITEQLDEMECYDFADHLFARDSEGFYAKRI